MSPQGREFAMNSETGQVLPESELREKLNAMDPAIRKAEQPKWRMFEIGEILEAKGIRFRVHEVGDQRLVLKFVKP
jgi:hypothetical protein